jgi:peptide/nickel transport system permease protein
MTPTARSSTSSRRASDLTVTLSAADAAFSGAVDAAVLMSERAAAAGITITVEREPNDGYWDNVWMKKPFVASYWGGRAIEDQMFTTAYATGAAWNESFWDQPRFNELLVAARSEVDEDTRRGMYHEMQQIVSFEGSTIIPMYNNYVMGVSDKSPRPRRSRPTGTSTASAAWSGGGSPEAALTPPAPCAPGTTAKGNAGGGMSDIWRMIAQRLLLGLLTLFIVSVVIFGATELLPGDLARELLGQSATPETLAALRAQLGLDQPAPVRYWNWLTGALQGDFGMSLANRRPISDLIATRLGNTLFLALYAAALAVPISLVLGILAALWRNSVFDRVANAGALTAISFPEFFVAYILILWLAQGGLFPSMVRISPSTTFWDMLYICFLPALTLTLVVTAHMMRMTRAAIINLMASPYIEMARLKGMSPLRIVVRHALPNALAPIINVVALNLAYLITGVVVVEVVFVYPGLGQLMVDSVSKRDIAVVQAVALIFAAAYVLLNLLADVLSTLSNPRLMHRR